MPVRQAVQRRRDRVMGMLPTLSEPAQRAILDSLTPAERARYDQANGEAHANGEARANGERQAGS
jgi:hypothetical protein